MACGLQHRDVNAKCVKPREQVANAFTLVLTLLPFAAPQPTERNHGANSRTGSAFCLRLCATRLDDMQWPAHADPGEHGALLAARNDLRRRWPHHVCVAEYSAGHAPGAGLLHRNYRNRT